MWSSARSRPATEDDFPVPIEVRPIRNARRMRLRFDEAAGVLKLTCPWRVGRRTALAWARDQSDWIEAQLTRALPAEPFEPDVLIPVEGVETRLVWTVSGSRRPVARGVELHCGGPLDGFARRIESHLKARALEVMSREAGEFASIASVTVKGVSIGDAVSRWGSCSSEGRIRLSWRLILAPPNVRRFVIAHEVAHLVHLNHGPDFKALEAALFGPGLARAKSDLRRLGPRLRRIGRRL